MGIYIVNSTLNQLAPYQWEAFEIRVLVALGSNYRAYQEVIAAGINILRPHVEVETAELDTLGREVARFQPQLVICSQPYTTVEPSGRLAWVELPVEGAQPTKVRIGERCEEFSGQASLEKLLDVIDEVEELARMENHCQG